MPTGLLRHEPLRTPRPGGHGPGGAEPPSGDGGEGGPSGTLAADPAHFGLWLFLGTLSMMFIGFTSAYMVRRASADWRVLAPPALLWVNTAVLLASSATLQTARRRLRGFDLRGTETWLVGTGLLGGAFFVGQVLVWRTLAGRGLFLASNPHNSFFYLLSGIHLVHLLAALIWFGVVWARLRRLAYLPGEDGLGLFATFWHFLGALWVYLALLLFVF